MNEKERLLKYVSVVPSEQQKIVQDMKFYAFLHYGMNTFTDREWGTGKESELLFNPSCQDTDQWCEILQAAGMKGVILTCKHHDGFCLWPTATTAHSVKNSPYKNGNGDVVREVSESCKKYGLKFGVYLSPWDRNSALYGTEQYNDFYIAQETELLTNYGEIFMLWLDGACDAASDGKPVQQYDFKRIWETARALQPNICISGCAPDIRWVGNESGIARESEWNVVPRFQYEAQNLAANCQQSDDCESFKQRCEDVMVRDLGSREFLSDFDDFMWYPAEVDVSIRRGWFYHESENRGGMRSLDNLMDSFYKAVGGNSLFLLNIPPDQDGRIHREDELLLRRIGAELRTLKDSILPSTTTQFSDSIFCVTFAPCKIDRIYMEENVDFSQRVERFSIYAETEQGEQLLYSGTIIGFGKLAVFTPVYTGKLTIKITQSRFEPHIKFIKVMKAGGYRIADAAADPFAEQEI